MLELRNKKLVASLILDVLENKQVLYPKTVEVGNERNVISISLGGAHSCAILDNDALKCWGSNVFGQLGDSTTSNRATPTTIYLGDDRYASSIALGFGHTCAIFDNKTLNCWGLNIGGQLGVLHETFNQLNNQETLKEATFSFRAQEFSDTLSGAKSSYYDTIR